MNAFHFINGNIAQIGIEICQFEKLELRTIEILFQRTFNHLFDEKASLQ